MDPKEIIRLYETGGSRTWLTSDGTGSAKANHAQAYRDHDRC